MAPFVSEKSAFRGLAAAIVIQAAEDYGNLLLGKYKEGTKYYYDLLDAKQFLESQDLHLYTNLDGETIKSKVEEMIKNWPKNRKFSIREENYIYD